MTPFAYSVSAARILFGPGTRHRLAEEIKRLDCKRVLVLSTDQQRADAEAIAAGLSDMAAGVFAEAVMHTPVGVTEAALRAFADAGADGVVAFGGGTTIGLGKAIAYRNDARQIVVATTYAGSEVTPILGQTEDGVKTTVRNPSILPETVIYDPELTVHLPVAMSVTSGLNAMAHAIEGLYSIERNPISSLIAVEGIRALRQALPQIVADPANLDARGEALYGAWLCGTVLGTVGMALHHKLCHVLGGSLNLPHAETHAVILPYSIAYNASAAAAQLAPLHAVFGQDLGAGIKAFAASLGAPQSLAEIGMHQGDIDRAAEIAMRNPYDNPRPLEHSDIRGLISRAWEGSPPAAA
jgi:maleylacetate reductase